MNVHIPADLMKRQIPAETHDLNRDIVNYAGGGGAIHDEAELQLHWCPIGGP